MAGTYNVDKDFLGPLYFMPSHCQDTAGREKNKNEVGNDSDSQDEDEKATYTSPVIATIKGGGDIQQDMVNSLKAIFNLNRGG